MSTSHPSIRGMADRDVLPSWNRKYQLQDGVYFLQYLAFNPTVFPMNSMRRPPTCFWFYNMQVIPA